MLLNESGMDTHYIISEKYLCLYALFEIILFDIGITRFTQYDLANRFGVTLPTGYSIPNVYNHVSYNDNLFMQGAHIDVDEMNSFFEENRIPLKLSYLSESPWLNHDYDRRIYSPIKARQYYIYAFSYGHLYHEYNNYRVGHVALLLNCPNDDLIEIYDPGPRNAGRKIVNRNFMHDAMDAIDGGVYFIKPI